MKRKHEILTETLDNGLQVILVHRPGYLKSLFLCGFGVGGMNLQEECAGEVITNPSGCAHFLEHQMFRLNGRDVTDDFADMQASCNAFTSLKETAYYFHTTADPKEPLALLLDFVQTLDISEQSIEKEKGIILSEYNMYDQRPESRLFQDIFKMLYANYPLNTDTLGTPEDIQNMTRDDLASFYERNYDPSRMILVGITGQPAAPLLDFIREHEKDYPSKTVCQTNRIFAAEPEEVKEAERTIQMDVTTPYVCIGYKFKPEGGIEENLRRDMAVNIWLDAVFGPLNPDWQTWLDQRILSQNCGAEGDFSSEHAYILFYAQTDKTEQFIDLVHSLTEHPPLLDPEVFEALRIPAAARTIRLQDNFENMALDILHSRLEHYDFEESLAIPMNLTLEETNEFIRSLEFKNTSLLIIKPFD